MANLTNVIRRHLELSDSDPAQFHDERLSSFITVDTSSIIFPVGRSIPSEMIWPMTFNRDAVGPWLEHGPYAFIADVFTSLHLLMIMPLLRHVSVTLSTVVFTKAKQNTAMKVRTRVMRITQDVAFLRAEFVDAQDQSMCYASVEHTKAYISAKPRSQPSKLWIRAGNGDLVRNDGAFGADATTIVEQREWLELYLFWSQKPVCAFVLPRAMAGMKMEGINIAVRSA